jgi:16S rRNA (uracil1498-N3)-methyltransferase
MRRYWIEKNQIENEIVFFTDDQFHHIFAVCRQCVGNHFEVITEESIAYLVKVIDIKKKSATAQIVETREIQKLPEPHIHIALSVSRYPVMDSIVERAVEMGVTSILPFVSDYSFIRKEKELPTAKMERWKKIIISATQQCGRGELMTIRDTSTMDKMLETINPNTENLCLFAYEGQKDENLKSIETVTRQHQTESGGTKTMPIKNIWLIIGSEGGFSEKEVIHMRNLGLDPVTLGSQILRVETACLTLVAVLKYVFGLMK